MNWLTSSGFGTGGLIGGAVGIAIASYFICTSERDKGNFIDRGLAMLSITGIPFFIVIGSIIGGTSVKMSAP